MLGKDFSLCGWVKKEASIRHIWAEVILDVSHTPAGQLVLGQVQAEAAQLENCGLGFRSLQESWTEHLELCLRRKPSMTSQMNRNVTLSSPVSAVYP